MPSRYHHTRTRRKERYLVRKCNRREQQMPHLEAVCLYCGGVIRDLLLECVPKPMRASAAFALLMALKPGVSFPCPYCSRLLGFDDSQQLRIPQTGWRVIRYCLAELELRK